MAAVAGNAATTATSLGAGWRIPSTVWPCVTTAGPYDKGTRLALGAASAATVAVVARCTRRPRGSFHRGQVGCRDKPTNAPEVPPPIRWDGPGVSRNKLDRLGIPPDDTAITLRPDMRIGEVIRILLSSNAVCMSSGKDDVFYVKVAPKEDVAGSSVDDNELFCISLEDVLQAPRQLPLNCILESEASEECQLYGALPEPYITRGPLPELMGRLPWLVGLLFFLTVSSAILEFYDALLQRHLVIAFYLTALVGCGGNSGSQAAALVLQGLATGELAPSWDDIRRVLEKELLVSFGIAAVLSVGVFARIALWGSPVGDAITIALSMAVMVLFSVLFGAAAPLVLQRLGADPAKVSGPLLSTVIDIVGVLVACWSAQLLEALGILH